MSQSEREKLARTFIVVPAYNEASCIETVVRELRRHYPDVNVVVVDDGSTDATGEIARGCATYSLHHLINCGQGAALQTGIQFALGRGAEYIVTFDADDQHRASDIEVLLEPIWSGECDITLGSRFLGQAINMSWGRYLTLRAAVLFTRLFNGVKVSDAHNGCRGFSRRAAQCINIKADGMAHASELIDIVRNSGYAFREVPVHVEYTEYSMSKGQPTSHAFRVAFHYLVERVVP